MHHTNTYKHLVDSKKKTVFLITILGLIIAIGPIAIDMYLPAFSAISESFLSDESFLQLSLTSYFIGISFGQIIYGPIIDRFGKKLPLLFGLALFAASSIACCYVNDIKHLILLRFFQAFGACCGPVVTRSIVRDIFSPQESGRIFSHLMLVMGIAPIIAPLAGSFALNNFGWKAIFLFLAAYGGFCFLISYFAVPETKGANKDEKISHAFKKYFGILHDKNFIASTLIGGFMMAGLFSYITGSPYIYLQYFGISASDYGIIFSINAVGFIIASQTNAYLLKKFSLTKLMSKVIFLPVFVGLAIILLGVFDAGFWPITIAIFSFLFCVGAIAPSSAALALANQGAHSGSASALLGTIQFTLAAICSFLISKFHDGSLLPMTIIVGCCGILPLVIFKTFETKAQIR